MTEKPLTKHDLLYFTGSERWFRHSIIRRVTYTEGAQFVAERGNAYWLLDEIALAQVSVAAVTTEEFQVWRLRVNADKTATLTCEDGNYKQVYSKPIPFTDFPLNEITFYFYNNVILLPREW